MNTLTENELAEIAASGDPVASWPVNPIGLPSPAWPGPGVVGGRNPLVPRMADS